VTSDGALGPGTGVAFEHAGQGEMIRLTRLDDREMIVNADLIKYVERTPDTIVTLTTGDKIIVRETPEEVVGRVIEYERKLRIFPRAC